MNEFSHWETWLQKWFIRLLAPALLINAGALFVTILEPDGALYALIAKTIARSGDFVNLRVGGNDWLDKPHFPFWMAALSMRLFGINEFGYKFPALLFWLMGAWYTYRLAFVLYGRGVAQLSVLIYVSAAHLVIRSAASGSGCWSRAGGRRYCLRWCSRCRSCIVCTGSSMRIRRRWCLEGRVCRG